MMNIKLSAIAVSVTLAFGAASAALAANEATIYQNGIGNDSSIEQYDNVGAKASVTTYGNFNDNVVVQQNTQATTATINTNNGSNNDNTITQDHVVGSSATVYQAADHSKVVIEQGGTTGMSGGGCWWGHCNPGHPVTIDGTN
jgi:hypothetical protein